MKARVHGDERCRGCGDEIYGGVYCRECSLSGKGCKEDRDSWRELRKVGKGGKEGGARWLLRMLEKMG